MANYLPNLPVKLKIARGKLEKYAREKFKIARGKSQKYAREQNNCPWQISKSKSFTGNLAIFGQNSHEKYPFARGKFQKSAREAQQLPVANQEIKKFHGQKKVSRGKKKTLNSAAKLTS